MPNQYPTAGHVILAVNLSDAWAAAKRHSILPGDWFFPRTVAEASSRTKGVVVEAPAFERREDARTTALRAAVRHLPRKTQDGRT